MEEVRLNKYLSDSGVCSRREADRLIEAGKVTVDGIPASMGMKVTPEQQIFVNGELVKPDNEHILLAVNKPMGVVCTTAGEEKDNIVDFIGYPKRVYPVGRLDKDSEGLILMTNQGELVNKILRGSNNHEKEYLVKVNRPVTSEFIKGMSEGVPILDTVTKPCIVERTGYNGFRIILTQGLNRQIRRMCEYFGYRVTYLKRVRVMNIKLGNLKPGGYRRIEGDEYRAVMELLKDSTGKTWAEVHAEKENKTDNSQKASAVPEKKVQSSPVKRPSATSEKKASVSPVKRPSAAPEKKVQSSPVKRPSAAPGKKVNVVMRRENSGRRSNNINNPAGE